METPERGREGEIQIQRESDREKRRSFARAREKKTDVRANFVYFRCLSSTRKKNVSANLALSNFISMVVIPNNGFVYIPSIMIIRQIKCYFAYFFYVTSVNVLFLFFLLNL